MPKKTQSKPTIKRIGSAARTAVGAASWAVGQMATGGEYGRLRNEALDRKVAKELSTVGVSKKRKPRKK